MSDEPGFGTTEESCTSVFYNSCGFIVSNTSINEFKLKPVYALKLDSPSWATCPCSPLPSWGEGACIGGHLAVVFHLC